MKNAFFCTTPYQVLTALTLSKQVDGESDVYIMDQFQNAERLVDAVKKSGKFQKVQLVREYPIFKMDRQGANPNKLRIRYIQIYLRLDQHVKEIIPDLSIYTDLFASCNSFVPRMFFLSAARNKLNMKYHFYDDGIGSYCNRKVYNLSGFDYYARRFLLGKRTTDIKYDLYLYRPDLFASLLPDIEITTHTIHPIQRSEEEQQNIDRVYHVHAYKEIGTKVLFLDTVHAEMKFPMGHDAVMREMNEIIAQIGQEEVLIKPHPRDCHKWFDCEYYQDSSQPMEVLCMHQDFTDKILMSYFSTAVITPKILYDQEPVLIMLYKVLGSNLNLAMKDKMCGAMKDIYRDKGRVYIPETKEELIGIIKALMNKGDKNA